MKRLITMAAAVLVSAAALAAQCEGKTLQGERCKREAAEGSKFCIGHADQAKAAAKAVADKKAAEDKKAAAPAKKAEAKKDAVEQDDGRCWAVTEAGTRCKHKKDGEKDYCRQHAANVKTDKPVKQCRAMTWSGTQCTRSPEAGFRYCKQHMGK
ncbi:MAG: hypothetical protein IJG84_13625 [Kiritimatiellae bacterium]|nr:hypothetical protein [Kiritimatiellia bacterium]